MKNQKGFIQIPLLIAIIAGVLVLGGGGYFGMKQYQNSQVQKLRKERLAQEIAKLKEEKSQQNQQDELENLKKEIENLKHQKPQMVIKEKEVVKEVPVQDSQNNNITSQDLSPYLSGIVIIYCGSPNGESSGSGSLWNFNGDYVVVTNNHVVSGNPTDCIIGVGEEGDTQSGVYRLNIKNILSWNTKTDSAVLKINEVLDPANSVAVSNLNYSLSTLKRCNVKMPAGSPVVVIGYPAFAQRDTADAQATRIFRTVTDGIISGHDTTVTEWGLPYSNYFISAKIDSGNSGGIALSKNNQGLCLLGLPTWLNIGNYETQGLIQNIHNVIYKQ